MAHEYHSFFGITPCELDGKNAILVRIGYQGEGAAPLYYAVIYQEEGESYDQTLIRAQAKRDEFLQQAFDRGQMCPERPGRSFARHPGKRNASGVVGVSLNTTRKRLKNGKLVERHDYHAYITCNHKSYRKNFSLNKYGEQQALEMAIAWRKDMEEKMLNPCRPGHRE